MPSDSLLMTATLIGMPSIAQVASSWLVIWKQPSPSIAHAVVSGRPTFAPIAAVADDRHVGVAVLADLRGVDVGVDDLGVRGERAELTGHPVVEAGAEAD